MAAPPRRLADLPLSMRAQLRPIVDTVVDASRGRGAEPASRMKLEPLGTTYQLAEVAELVDQTDEGGSPGRRVRSAWSTTSPPARIRRGSSTPWQAGVVLIEGGRGSGRTTLLQTLAVGRRGLIRRTTCGCSASTGAREVWCPLRPLPHCVGVVDADDVGELERLGDARAASSTIGEPRRTSPSRRSCQTSCC